MTDGIVRYLQQKKRDFVHLLFNEANAERVLQFEAVMQGL